MPRYGSPVSGSTFTTSAPQSPRMAAQLGPATQKPSSTTLMPCIGPATAPLASTPPTPRGTVASEVDGRPSGGERARPGEAAPASFATT